MTPNEIEILIHCYTSPERHQRYSAPAIIQSMVMLEACGLIEKTEVPHVYKATDRGRAHVMQMCHLSLPLKGWIGENGQIIHDY